MGFERLKRQNLVLTKVIKEKKTPPSLHVPPEDFL
jgi:hypothetical protein